MLSFDIQHLQMFLLQCRAFLRQQEDKATRQHGELIKALKAAKTNEEVVLEVMSYA